MTLLLAAYVASERVYVRLYSDCVMHRGALDCATPLRSAVWKNRDAACVHYAVAEFKARRKTQTTKMCTLVSNCYQYLISQKKIILYPIKCRLHCRFIEPPCALVQVTKQIKKEKNNAGNTFFNAKCVNSVNYFHSSRAMLLLKPIRYCALLTIVFCANKVPMFYARSLALRSDFAYELAIKRARARTYSPNVIKI